MEGHCCRCGEETNGIYIRAAPEFCHYDHGGWTHWVCDKCWGFFNPDRQAVRIKE